MTIENIVVSYSEIDSYRQCAFKHQLGYRERWTSSASKPALARGTAWHAMQEERYRLKQMVDAGTLTAKKASTEAVVAALMVNAEVRAAVTHLEKQKAAGLEPTPRGPIIPEEEAELLAWMMLGDLELYGDDPDWKVLAVEVNSTHLLPGQAPRARKRFYMKVKIDLVVAERFGSFRRMRVVDHKSGKDLPSDKELDIEDQFKLYTWILRAQGHDIFGQTYNAARTQRNKSAQTLESRFKRYRLYTEDAELEVVARDALRAAKAAHGRLEEGEDAPRSPNGDTCKWKCDYTEACLWGRKGHDSRLMLRDRGYVQDFTRH